MRYTESTLQSWTTPLSDTEEKRVENTITMIKESIKLSPILSNYIIDIFAQGSYANNTNVRKNSDVDVCVMLTSEFYTSYPENMTREDYGFTTGTSNYDKYKSYIVEALRTKFGSDAIKIGNKSIQIESNSYRVNADVVPTFQYRDYKVIGSKSPEKYVEGVKFFSSNGDAVVNYPREHIENGKQKNKETNYNYKKLVRIFKHIRNSMVDENKIDKSKITSFLIECLVWNVPNNIILQECTWEEKIDASLKFLLGSINNDRHKEWGEVSERLYLFYGRKWTSKDAENFLLEMKKFLW